MAMVYASCIHIVTYGIGWVINSHTGIDHCAGIVVTRCDALRSRFRQGFVPHELPLVEPLGIWCNLGEFTSARLEYHPYSCGISWVYNSKHL
jgi:hypothetical protein